MIVDTQEEVGHDHVRAQNCFVSKTIPIVMQYKTASTVAHQWQVFITPIRAHQKNFKGAGDPISPAQLDLGIVTSLEPKACSGQ